MIESVPVLYPVYSIFTIVSFIKQNGNKGRNTGIKCDLAQSFSKGPKWKSAYILSYLHNNELFAVSPDSITYVPANVNGKFSLKPPLLRWNLFSRKNQN